MQIEWCLCRIGLGKAGGASAGLSWTLPRCLILSQDFPFLNLEGWIASTLL